MLSIISKYFNFRKVEAFRRYGFKNTVFKGIKQKKHFYSLEKMY